MAKVILSMDGVTLKEIPLVKERTMIGRKAHNDIQIDNLAVSGEHATIITLLNDSFLEDLESTNGTYVNGRPVKKHFLQDGDVIELAKYRLKYVSEGSRQADIAAAEKTQVLRPDARGGVTPNDRGVPAHLMETAQPTIQAPRITTSARLRGQLPAAMIQVLNGKSAGREMELTKTLTTLGRPGVVVAAIARRPQGYFITHIEGTGASPIVGSQKLETNRPHALQDHDIIELGGVKMEFFLKG
jgi:pSer/pThr/pTyr-binding forkhead associated (FHA) protein